VSGAHAEIKVIWSGYRLIDETRSNLLGFGMNYRMTEKHTLTLRELFELEKGETLAFTIGLIRKLPRWFRGNNEANTGDRQGN